MQPFELQALTSEVDQQPDLEIVDLQVVHALYKMLGKELGYGFDLYGKETFDEEIHPAMPHVAVFVDDVHDEFADVGDAVQLQFVRKCALIDLFLEASSENAMHLHGAANDLARELVVTVVGIHVSSFLDDPTGGPNLQGK
jgi:hypothetical protein